MLKSMWSLGGRVRTPVVKRFIDIQIPQCDHKRSEEHVESAYGKDELSYHRIRFQVIPI
jgi:hypothetical protein